MNPKCDAIKRQPPVAAKALPPLAAALCVGLVATGCAKKSEKPASAKATAATTLKSSAPSGRQAPPEPVAEAVRAVHASPSGAVDIVRGIAAGDVALAISDELVAATEANRRTLVYVGATWCEPCKRFKKAVLAGELDAQLKGLRFLEFDADRDGERLQKAGYSYTFVPYFGTARFDGKAAGPSAAGVPQKDSPMGPLAKRVALLASGVTDTDALAP